MEFKNIIGNTPMIKIKYKYNGETKSLYAKLEYYNLTGSIKDRLAYHIIKTAYQNNTLKKHQPIIEATSGNTGISFAALGAKLEHPVHIFMPDWVSQERINLMKLYGANVHLVTKQEGGFKKAIEKANNLAKDINGFRPNQFENIENTNAHYLTTGKEIINQLKTIKGFVSGIGTGGTLMGVSKRIKETNPNAIIIAMEPDKMPILSQGKIIDNHKIEGIGDDFIPNIVNRNIIDKIITVNDDDAINMTRLLSKKLGLGVGISSGANLIAAIKSNIDEIVTIFPDDSKKYLSTELVEKIQNNQAFISNQIELIDFSIV